MPVFQGTAVPSEHLSQFVLYASVAELRSSPPLWRTLEQLDRLSPADGPLQGTDLADSLSRLSSSVESTAKCVSVGPAHEKERLSYSIRCPAAVLQQGYSYFGRPRAGFGYGTGSRHSFKESSLCGPMTNSSCSEQFTFLGISMWEQTSCRDRGRGPGNGCFTQRW